MSAVVVVLLPLLTAENGLCAVPACCGSFPVVMMVDDESPPPLWGCISYLCFKLASLGKGVDVGVRLLGDAANKEFGASVVAQKDRSVTSPGDVLPVAGIRMLWYGDDAPRSSAAALLRRTLDEEFWNALTACAIPDDLPAAVLLLEVWAARRDLVGTIVAGSRWLVTTG